MSIPFQKGNYCSQMIDSFQRNYGQFRDAVKNYLVDFFRQAFFGKNDFLLRDGGALLIVLFANRAVAGKVQPSQQLPRVR